VTGQGSVLAREKKRNPRLSERKKERLGRKTPKPRTKSPTSKWGKKDRGRVWKKGRA